MATLYEIAKWSEVFETAESRRHKALNWISMPISFTSSGYQSMLDEFGSDAPAMYGAWCVLVAFAAQCPTRGRLGNNQGTPVSWHAIARVTGFSVRTFERLAEWASRDNVKWLIAVRTDENTAKSDDFATTQDSPSRCPGDAQANTGLQDPTRPNKTQPNKTQQLLSPHGDGDEPDLVTEFISAWNNSRGSRPARSLNAKRLRALNARLIEPEWDWRSALAKFPLQCTADDPHGWQPDLDWFLRPDSVNKILEGKYDWKKGGNSNGKQQSRVGPGQRYSGPDT